jgi:hypothetical protein
VKRARPRHNENMIQARAFGGGIMSLGTKHCNTQFSTGRRSGVVSMEIICNIISNEWTKVRGT